MTDPLQFLAQLEALVSALEALNPSQLEADLKLAAADGNKLLADGAAMAADAQKLLNDAKALLSAFQSKA